MKYVLVDRFIFYKQASNLMGCNEAGDTREALDKFI